MPGNGTIGGGGSCHVYFTTDSGNQGCVHDEDAQVGKSKVTVTFPQEKDIKVDGGNSVTVKLKDGETVHFEWKGARTRKGMRLRRG
jgi:hypothetical protein